MEPERPGGRRPGQGMRPGSRPPGGPDAPVQLTVPFDAPPDAGSAPSTAESPAPRRTEVSLEQLIAAALPAVQEAARAAGMEAGREEARAFFRQVRAELQTATEEVAAASQGMDILLNESSVRADETLTLFQTACTNVIGKLEEVKAVAERLAEGTTTRSEEGMKRLHSVTDRAVEEARDAARAASWRPWVMATACALVLMLCITLLRPGWAMSPSQRRAERVGDTVIRMYEAASPADRARMREVMGWREPLPVETPARRR